MLHPNAHDTLESDQERIDLLEALIAENPEICYVDKPVDEISKPNQIVTMHPSNMR